MSTHKLAGSTEQLIDTLVVELRPTPRFAVTARLAAGVVAGAAGSFALLVVLLGARPDLALVAETASFWMKLAYTIGTAAAALFIAARISRPGASTSAAWILLVPLLLYIPVGAWELANTDRADWIPMLLGHGWRQCTWLVVALSIPVFLGLWWAFKKLAPTQLAFAGAVAGLGSAAVSAIVYCIHCPADTAVFALAWYTLAFVIASGLGALAGTRLLRW
jgi:hypothetical protein